MDYSRTGDYQGRAAVRDTAPTLHRHGRGERCLRGDPCRRGRLVGQIQRALPSRSPPRNVSVCRAHLYRKPCSDGPDPPTRGEALAEDGEDGLCGRTAPHWRILAVRPGKILRIRLKMSERTKSGTLSNSDTREDE